MNEIQNSGTEMQSGSIVGDVDSVQKINRSYDSYYDDVEVEDKADKIRRKTDSGLALKISLIVFGLLTSIAVCVTVLCLV